MYRKRLFTLMSALLLVFLFIQPAMANTEEMLEKQAEIDQYLFVDHLEELEELGIHVTHTSPTETHVEIGISPYSEEHAQYLTEIFGAEVVKVVEGQQAVTLTAGSDSASPETSIQNQTEASSRSGSASVWWYMGAGAALLAAVLFVVARRKKETAS